MRCWWVGRVLRSRCVWRAEDTILHAARQYVIEKQTKHNTIREAVWRVFIAFFTR